MSASTQKPPSANVKHWQVPAICLVLAAITFAVFGQTLAYDFINFDDGDYVYENPMVARGLTRPGIVWAFTGSHAYNWHPLTWLSHMLDCQLYGLHPGGHHLTNVLIHTATAITLFLVLRSMTGALWRSAFVAAVFAIHPLRVESVAWVAERKDVLSGLFFMLTVGAYVRYATGGARLQHRERCLSLLCKLRALNRSSQGSTESHPTLSKGWYCIVLLLFALGLMCKPMLVTLPLVLLLLDYWPLQRKESAGRLVMEKLPLLALSAASCVATLLAQKSVLQPTTTFSLPLRLGNALVSGMVYLGQMVYPAGLALFYPYSLNDHSIWEEALAAAMLAGFSAVVLWQRRRQPWLLVGWFWFLVMLLPVVGIIQVGGQAHADRYTYLPQIGIYMAVTWLAAGWVAKRTAADLMPVVIAALMFCAWRQTAYWKNSETLWTRSLVLTTRNETAHYGLGTALLHKGNMDDAIFQFEQALQIRPDYAEARNDLGIAILKKGRVDDAIAQFQQVLQIQPNHAPAHYNLGGALLKKDRANEAITHFQKALQANPDYAAAHYNLGVALLQTGRVDEAITHFQKALQIEPDSAETHNYLGNALLQKGRLDEAIVQFQKALQIEPVSASPHLNMGIALFQKGGIDQAIAQFQKALQIQTNYAAAHYNLGNALAQKGRTAKAISHYQQALQINPDDVEVQNNLAWLLATCAEPSLRNGKQALELARRANERTGGGNPFILHTLAAALAEAGQFAEAIRTAQKALALARVAGEQDLVEQLNGELRRYEAGLPTRE